ncbi:sigma-70 family RNA polymerase sigma factor [Lignipirellula cremea]|uniref:RNA polymerase sigma factor SigA n=1 Tax=Lignipirellula cremea TaxID=2528010 RepID=A0A518E0J3_9BACT|nr:sigma-70 family RNA polymerase sigma factor [Lignipirellula cremea]QDU97610.1 RNA polymerase sigma factor SigA [Lignipirellula cremea]
MHGEYKTKAMRQLADQQSRFAPREKKLEQLNRAEQLIREVEAAKNYSYEYLCFRITGYRPDTGPGELATGGEVRRDLQFFIEDLSDSADISAAEVGEPVLTLEEVSRMFNVSTKTISRWRQQGLVSRRFVLDGRKRVGFLNSSVDRFVEANRDRVKRGERFSQLTDHDRDDIIDRARRLARSGACPADVTRRIARHMNRSVETIRYTLRQFDQRNPDMAVFPDHKGPLTIEAKEKIYQQYRRGDSPDALAKRYCRTKSSIHRIVSEMRALRILDLPLDYIPNDCFENAEMEAEIVAPMPESTDKPRKARMPSGLPSYLASLYETALLNAEQEAHLFRKFNFLKHKAKKLREELDPARARASLMDEIESLYEEAIKVKNQIVQANLRLVVSIAKRHVNPTDDFFQLVSDGNMSLIRAAEKFDYGRGNKFSTYASWAIMKNFARTIPEEYKQRDRYRTSTDEMFSAQPDNNVDLFTQESTQAMRERQVERILSALDEREQKIIISRFGLNYQQEPQTLKEVGAEMGVTKERIRQIEARALNKLRAAAQDEKIEFFEEED